MNGCRALTGPELQARREALGLTEDALAGYLRVSRAMTCLWEAGICAVPEWVAAELESLEARCLDLVDRMIEAAEADPQVGFFVTYADDVALWAAHPALDGMPAVVYRVAAARARAELACERRLRIVAAGDRG